MEQFVLSRIFLHQAHVKSTKWSDTVHLIWEFVWTEFVLTGVYCSYSDLHHQGCKLLREANFSTTLGQGVATNMERRQHGFFRRRTRWKSWVEQREKRKVHGSRTRQNEAQHSDICCMCWGDTKVILPIFVLSKDQFNGSSLSLWLLRREGPRDQHCEVEPGL